MVKTKKSRSMEVKVKKKTMVQTKMISNQMVNLAIWATWAKQTKTTMMKMMKTMMVMVLICYLTKALKK